MCEYMALWISFTQFVRSVCSLFMELAYGLFLIVPSTRNIPAAAHALPVDQ